MRRAIFSIAVLFLAVLASWYAYLSVYAARPLKLSEFTRFSRVILFASSHTSEGGMRRGLELIKQALTSPADHDSVEVDGRKYDYPLPKYSVRQREDGNYKYYLAFVTNMELEQYFDVELPQAGWRYSDQMGAAHFYQEEGAGLMIRERKYLTSEISDIEVSVVLLKR